MWLLVRTPEDLTQSPAVNLLLLLLRSKRQLYNEIQNNPFLQERPFSTLRINNNVSWLWTWALNKKVSF